MQAQDQQVPLAVGMTHRPNARLLTREEIRFEIDMCVGCDRCMRACPLPLSSTLTIAELNRATIATDMTPQVARFADECVMCGSCVPVCPVNNHRDLLMLSLKQRLGIPWESEIPDNRLQSRLPAGWQITQLLRSLREQTIFRDAQLVPDKYLLHFVAASNVLTLLPGTQLIQEGEFERTIYFILEGRCELFTTGADGKALPLAIVRHGEFIGEQEMLSGQQRNSSARAITSMVVLEATEQAMQRLMEIVPAVQHFFAQLNAARSIETVLSRLPLFAGVAEEDLYQLSRQAQLRRYERNERLFSEDNHTQPARESMHILLDGFVRVARRTATDRGHRHSGERIVAYRQGGDYFAGGLDMLGDRRAVSVTAITRTSVAELSRTLLLAFFRRYPQVEQRFQERLQLYREAIAAAHSAVFEPLDASPTGQKYAGAEARAGLHALVEGGVVEGTDVLVIDLAKCIHCNECEEACARRHGRSRMNRTGMVIGNMSIATACRQCQDPVCMLCSRAGIARLPSGEVYITESCIGCGICAERCPYDNISIVSLADDEPAAEQHTPTSWRRFSTFFAKGNGKEAGRKSLPMLNTTSGPGPFQSDQTGDAIGELRKKIALKCDLCAGYNNQACVQACPTGAALRINPITFFGTTEEILSKRS